ncbi:MAG: protein-disulfide reductase DsbD, partial [Proteobacteria bacterium]
YPPIMKEVELSLPIAEAQAAPADAAASSGAAPLSTPVAAGDAVDELRNLLGNLGVDDEFLPVDEAFRLTLDAPDGSRVDARYEVAQGYYLYQDKITFNVVSGAARTGEPNLPPGKKKEDEYFGLMTVYLEDFEVGVPLIRSAPEAGRIVVEAGYQGCAEQGICYPPVTRQFTLDLPRLLPAARAETAQEPPAASTSSGRSGNSFVGYLLSAFGVGLLLTFTPCVLPMIPILSSIIVGQGANMTRAKGGALSFIYVLGTAVTYAVIGWVAGATGEQLQAYFQNIWAIGVLAVVFVLMALSMFGLYKIQMPSFIQSRLQQTSSTIQGGTASMVFVLGLMSALIVGACVSPLLISLLTIAITEGDPVLGASMMVAMAAGMGVFLVAIGMGAGFLLPRAGAWMERVNYVFGVMLIAVAIYLLTAVPTVPVLLLWAALLIIVGVYMGATQALPEGASGWRYLNKGIGTIALVWGVLALVGGLAGNRDIMNPIPAGTFGVTATAGGGQDHEETLFVQVSSLEELDAQLAVARDQGRHLMLDFYADWCTDCIRMEKSTFVDTDVRRRFDREFVLAQVDVTDPNHEGGKAIKRRYGVYGPPAMLFFREGGEEIRDLRLYGYRGKDEFLAILDGI